MSYADVILVYIPAKITVLVFHDCAVNYFQQVDDDPPMAFHQVFMLKSQNCAWACTNDVFRLGIHNIPV